MRLEEALERDDEFAKLMDDVENRQVDPATAATTLLERVDAAEAAPNTGG